MPTPAEDPARNGSTGRARPDPSAVATTASPAQARPGLAQLATYVPGAAAGTLAERSADGRTAPLASNEHPLGPAPAAVAALRDAADQVGRYPDGAARALTEAVARAHAIDPRLVLTANGADNALTVVGLGMLHPEGEAVVPVPSFAAYRTASLLAGATLRTVEIGDEGLDVEAVRAAVTPRTRVVWLASPNNPTGAALSRADAQRLLDALPAGAALVLDEAYAEFRDDPALADGIALAAEGAPVIAVRTFSKAHGLAGVRAGYLVAHPTLVAELAKVREPFALNHLAEAAAVAALGDTEHLEAARELVARQRPALIAALEARGARVAPSQGNFVWADLGVDAATAASRLLDHGVAIRPGGAWGRPQHARITVGTPEQQALLLEALDAVLPHCPTSTGAPQP